MIRREPSVIKLTDEDIKDWKLKKRQILDKALAEKFPSSTAKSGSNNEFLKKIEDRKARIGI